jgi:hypothetical protein
MIGIENFLKINDTPGGKDLWCTDTTRLETTGGPLRHVLRKDNGHPIARTVTEDMLAASRSAT